MTSCLLLLLLSLPFPSNCMLKRFIPSVVLAFVAAMRTAGGAYMEPTVLHSLVSELRTVYDVCEAERMPHMRVQSSHDCLSNRHEAEHRGNRQTTESQTHTLTPPHPTPPFLHIMAPEWVTPGVGMQISLTPTTGVPPCLTSSLITLTWRSVLEKDKQLTR